MGFTIDWFALIFGTAIALVFLWLYRQPEKPSFTFSSLDAIPASAKRQSRLPLKLKLFSALCFLFAFINPQLTFPNREFLQTRNEIPVEGAAVYLLIDQSGSMQEIIDPSRPIPKLDFAKEVAQRYVADYPANLIGLIAFARIPKILVPLTLDREDLYNALKQLKVVATPEDDGTAIGYAIYKAVSLIAATKQFNDTLPTSAKQAYTITSSTIIIITDGFQDPNRLDYGNPLRTMELEEAATEAKKNGVKVYVINVDPRLASDENFAPNRRQMESITRLTGGDFFSLKHPSDINEVFAQIAPNEKARLPVKAVASTQQPELYPLYPYLTACGLILLVLALLLETTILRQVP